MKIIEPAIYELLKSLASGRVYLLRAPQRTSAPYIIYQQTDSNRWRSIKGPSGIAQAFIQVDCYGDTVYEAKMLGTKVETILDGYDGTVHHDDIEDEDGIVQNSVKIAGISLQNELTTIDQTDSPFLYRNWATYLVTYYQ